MLEGLIVASTNLNWVITQTQLKLTHNMTRLFNDLPVQYMKTTSSEHVVYINCSECQNKKQFVYTTCSELGIFMYWTRNSMNNLSSYCGLVDARISASDKDLPVPYFFRVKTCQLIMLIYFMLNYRNSVLMIFFLLDL